MITEESTIKQAKDHMRPLLLEGVKCPCCQQHAQMYQRSITSSMALGLILMYNYEKKQRASGEYEDDMPFPIHIESFFKGIKDVPASIRGDIPKLRFWGLIEPMGKVKPDNNPHSGDYHVTKKGASFVNNLCTVMSHVNIYNNEAYGFPVKAKEVTIIDALKNKFNYSKLMNP